MTKKEFAAALDSALKAVRKEYGFTQEKMAAVLGISKKTLVEIEKGRGRVWWREIWKEKGYRIQQNVVSGHFRLLDRENRRLMASFTLERVMERLKEELQ